MTKLLSFISGSGKSFGEMRSTGFRPPGASAASAGFTVTRLSCRLCSVGVDVRFILVLAAPLQALFGGALFLPLEAPGRPG